MSDAPLGGRAMALPPGLVRAVARGVVAFLAADAPAIAGLGLAAGVAIATGHTVVAHGAAVLGLALVANAVHELGHVAAYRVLAPHGRVTLECGTLMARIRREPLPRRRDRLVTAAGPLAPLAASVAATPLVTVAPAEVIAGWVLGVAHAVSLALPTADRRAWRAAGPSPAERRAPTLGA
ncbi:hypothetical protein H4J02_03235 [Protaetiibacter sp. SSC-01]|uniref:hypothetical protein n=1 Tax=Protaetiibacter sp. SSC-01 TaxID=2759943 RepID=UPI001656BE0F|nr:hypothetical protein [Protaetiibacter sp. SSC-01]QNO38057.1 hypothetical protein H4J02_03235 [Protaetiibacter sp. SSC-01]